jgi:8-amino-7-oxononanoate synthase
MTTFDSFFAQALERASNSGLRRRLRLTTMAAPGRIVREGRDCLDLSSNDYLGLAQHPLLKERAAEWALHYGAGAGSSRLVTGTADIHLEVEAKIARFKGTESALIFASGWQANATMLPALVKAIPGAQVFTDRLIHASLHQGCAAAGVKQIRFRHNDLDHLDTLLRERTSDAPAIIVTESVFSMDGDCADLARLNSIAKTHGAFVYLDEAHATGVLGPHGRGLSAAMPGSFDLVMGTFSKALGGFGAYVAGSAMLCDYLVNACSGFIFTTAPPPSILGAIDAALDLVPTMDADRARLAALSDRVRDRLRDKGLDVGPSTTQIVPVIVGDADRAVRLSRELEEANIIAAAIRPPTVPQGSSRLRLALRSTLSDDDVDHLLRAIDVHAVA